MMFPSATQFRRFGNLTTLILFAIALPSLVFADAASTLLIHQALGKELAGRRRANIELMTTVLDKDRFVVYDAKGQGDPIGWSILHESVENYTPALERDLKIHKYDIQRTYVLTNVAEGKAFVAIVDSGIVTDRATGGASQYLANNLWMFEKKKEEWLATAFIHNVGDTNAGRFDGPTSAAPDLEKFLRKEAQAWRDGSANTIAGLYHPSITVFDAYHTDAPTGWVIIFSKGEIFNEWLAKRLDLTRYDIERNVIHTNISASGTEALAITQDRVTVSHNLGNANHSADRHVLWTLSKQGGDWLVTNLFWNLRRPD